MDGVMKALKQMDNSIKNLEMDLQNAARSSTDPDDMFAESMGQFSKETRQQCAVLQTMYQNMETLYTSLSEYFCFDKMKYTLEEFFTDVKTFKDQFKKTFEGILKERENEAKLVRAREAREKADKERSERAAKKRALVDFNAPDDQEGVMDSLLEALKTGSAFSRDQKRKRAPRAAGAERRAQLNRSRSRGPNSNFNKDLVEILMEAEENQPPPISSVSSQLPASGGVAPLMAGGADSAATAQRRERRNQRQAAHINQNHREREVSATGIIENSSENGATEDALMRKLRAL